MGRRRSWPSQHRDSRLLTSRPSAAANHNSGGLITLAPRQLLVHMGAPEQAGHLFFHCQGQDHGHRHPPRRRCGPDDRQRPQLRQLDDTARRDATGDRTTTRPIPHRRRWLLATHSGRIHSAAAAHTQTEHICPTGRARAQPRAPATSAWRDVFSKLLEVALSKVTRTTTHMHDDGEYEAAGSTMGELLLRQHSAHPAPTVHPHPPQGATLPTHRVSE